jgi:chaperone modulatory protein CbpM
MNDTESTYLSFTEVCLQTGVAEDTVFEIVEHGIIEPIGTTPDEWLFSPTMLTVTKKAVRLHRDLEVDWAVIALAIELLDEVEQLREQNLYLQRRLSRFVDM